MKSLTVRPINLRDAAAFISAHHRHHGPPRGWRFGVGVEAEGELVGVAVAGRPVAHRLDDGLSLEVTRCCTDGTPHVASKLYAAIRRAAVALGYRRIFTYTLASEAGVSLRAAGWRPMSITKGASWSVPSRPRVDKHPIVDKVRWHAP